MLRPQAILRLVRQGALARGDLQVVRVQDAVPVLVQLLKGRAALEKVLLRDLPETR